MLHLWVQIGGRGLCRGSFWWLESRECHPTRNPSFFSLGGGGRGGRLASLWVPTSQKYKVGRTGKHGAVPTAVWWPSTGLSPSPWGGPKPCREELGAGGGDTVILEPTWRQERARGGRGENHGAV